MQVGEVTDVGLMFNPKTLDVKPRVEIVVYPELVVAQLPTPQSARMEGFVKQQALRHELMQKLVEERGLRAQLGTGSLVTGQRFVSLGYYPKAPKARMTWDQTPAQLPTVLSTLPEVEEKLSRIIDKIEKMPLDTIGEEMKNALASLDETLRGARTTLSNFDRDVTPALKTALEDARGALGAAEKMLTSTETNLVGPGAPGQVELRNAMQELARAARSLRVLTDYLERHPESLLRGKTAEPSPK